MTPGPERKLRARIEIVVTVSEVGGGKTERGSVILRNLIARETKESLLKAIESAVIGEADRLLSGREL